MTSGNTKAWQQLQQQLEQPALTKQHDMIQHQEQHDLP